MKKSKHRFRWTTLALLWGWAIATFLVLDLFINIDGFDSIRPRSDLYRGMRVAAHKLVGEPVEDGVPRVDVYTARAHPAEQMSPAGLRDALVAAREAETLPHLQELAANAEDARVRIAALRRMAKEHGAEARPFLEARVHDAEETQKTRRRAAMLLGDTGPEADATLLAMAEADLPGFVRDGVVIGLGRAGTGRAVDRILELAEGKPGRVRASAWAALAAVSRPDATDRLVAIARDALLDARTRVAACRALVRHDGAEATEALGMILADAGAAPSLRCAAADSLGKRRDRKALAAVETACKDKRPEVARAARLARNRLAHVKES